MPATFSRTLRSLSADRAARPSAAIAVALVVIAGWTAWLLVGRVTLFEVAPDARIEVDRAAFVVDAPVEGRLVRLDAALGREVEEGDVLAEVDAAPERLAVEVARARLDSLAAKAAPLARRRAAEEEAIASLDEALAADVAKASSEVAVAAAQADGSRAAADRARADVETAKLDAAWLVRHAGVLDDLAARKLEPNESALEARAKADSSRARVTALEAGAKAFDADVATREAGVTSLRLAAQALAPARKVERKDRLARVEALCVDEATLAGERAEAAAEIRRLEQEVERRVVRAPVAGRVSGAPRLSAGSVVEVGTRLAVIVPRSGPRVVASFSPRAAGRVRVGQTARLRFDGYPWTRFGFRTASVTTIGAADGDGRVPVELALNAAPDSAIPVEHGLACTAEIEVERTSPADLVLRSAGRVLDGVSPR